MNYIITWFYRESADEASFYPQMGQRGDSALVHSVYMQIQVPFFRTFRHYNPKAWLLFFTNLRREGLPRFLLGLFDELGVTSGGLRRAGTAHGRTSSTCTTSSAGWAGG